MKISKKLIHLSLIGLLFFAMTACGGGIDADAKKAAQYRCKMVELQNQAKNASGDEVIKLEKEAKAEMKKMNNIRKKYFKKSRRKKLSAFEKLMDKYVAECGG